MFGFSVDSFLLLHQFNVEMRKWNGNLLSEVIGRKNNINLFLRFEMII